LEWQIANIDRGIQYISVELKQAKLFIFVDGLFANNKDFSSQIGYIIILANKHMRDDEFVIEGNIVHYSSIKSKRVTQSILASEIYRMIREVNMAIAVNTTLNMILEQLRLLCIPAIICTDSFSLYKCLVKLRTTKEKHLMINIMALHQSYKCREISEVRWINGKDNPADSITKINPNKSLQILIDSNRLTVQVEGWMDRKK
jgi:hypothetical protein